MNLKQLITKLNSVLEKEGNMDVSISICEIREKIKKQPDLFYLISESIIPVVENCGDKKYLMLDVKREAKLI